ncbi:predicted protein [Nematostella vectensis]|uniref:EF-hand domain-containing protein n=1 Tax=Nematostella vectensis TaxID=45351 RepID=A7RK79_NEMVE|nr:predicted protein [Nematostella vectensis]|eukprot:XP_001640184.1 predicted protein [Nematostella vectensis]
MASHKKKKRETPKLNTEKSKPTFQSHVTVTVCTMAFVAIVIGVFLATPYSRQQARQNTNVSKTTSHAKSSRCSRGEGKEEIPNTTIPMRDEKRVDVGKEQARSYEDRYKHFKTLPRLQGVKVGHVQQMELVPGKLYQVHTRSLHPPIFEIPEFLSDAECQQIIDQSVRQGMDTSEVQDPEIGMKIEATTEETYREWDYDGDGVISVTEIMHNLVDLSDLYFSEDDVKTMLRDLNIDKNGNGVMDLNEFLLVTTDGIMRYLHEMAKGLPRVKSRHSRQTWVDHRAIRGLNQRYATVLYFLNDVEEGGETAFPVADNETFSIEAWAGITKYRCDLSRHCHKANLYIKPKKRSAIMWYNHYTDELTGWFGGLDPMTYHGGCDVVRGRKWIANNWINIMGASREHMYLHTDPEKRVPL